MNSSRQIRIRLFCFGLLLLGLATAVACPVRCYAQGLLRTPKPESVRVVPRPGHASAMLVDQLGFLWLATPEGLMRFDGISYRVIDRSLIDEAATALAKGLQTVIWVGTHGGKLFRRDGLLATTKYVATLPGAMPIDSLAVDGAGAAWVVSNGALFSVTEGSAPKVWSQGLADKRVRQVSVERDGALWIATDQGLLRCERPGPHPCEAAGPNFDIQAFGSMSDHRIFALSPQGLFILGGERTIIATRHVAGAIASFALAMFPYDKGALIGDSEGLAWTNGARLERFRLPGVPAGVAIEAAALAANHDVWLFVQNLGLVQLRAQTEMYLVGVPSDEFPRPVFSLAFDQAGALWQNAGVRLRRWEAGAWLNFAAPSVLKGWAMRGLSVSPAGEFWSAPLDGGLFRFSDGEFARLGMADGLPFEVMSAVFHDSRSRMWVSGMQGGLAVKEPGGMFEVIPDSNRLCAAGATGMVEEPGGSLWFATDGSGLCHYESTRLQRYTKAEGLPSDRLRSLHLDRGGNLWIGTARDGLAVRRKQEFLAIPKSAGLGLTDVAAINEDVEENLWISATEGLLKVSIADLLAYLDGRRESIRHLRFGTADGLRNLSFMAQYPPASLRGPDGALYFPSHAGVLAIPNPPAVRSPEPLVVLIEGLKVDGRAVARDLSGLSLPAHATLEVAIAVPRLDRPQRVRIVHRLEGLEKAWRDSPDLNIVYQDLPSGSYVLRIATAGRDTDARNETALPVKVRMPLYFRFWFIAACGALLLALGWATYRLRVWALRSRFEAIVGERSRIARDMHDTLEQNLVAVKLQLESLERYATEPAQVTRYTETALNLLDQTMRESKGSIWSLRLSMATDADLSTNLSVCAGRLLKGTELQFHLQTEGKPYRLSIETEQQLLRLVQEAITNIVKHASARAVSLRVEFGEASIKLVLKDDGVGLDLERVPGASEGHFGLQGMRERVAHLAGEMQIHSAPGQGVELVFILPRGKVGRSDKADALL